MLFASAHDNSGEGVTAAVTAQMMERTGFRKLSTYLALLLLVKGALVKDLYYTGTETKLLIILEKRGKGIVTVKLWLSELTGYNLCGGNRDQSYERKCVDTIWICEINGDQLKAGTNILWWNSSDPGTIIWKLENG